MIACKCCGRPFSEESPDIVEIHLITNEVQQDPDQWNAVITHRKTKKEHLCYVCLATTLAFVAEQRMLQRREFDLE